MEVQHENQQAFSDDTSTSLKKVGPFAIWLTSREVKRRDPNTDAFVIVELLANRGDHHCYMALHEICGRTGQPTCHPDMPPSPWVILRSH